MQKRVLKGIFIPETVSVENEHFFAFGAPENQVLIEHVNFPQLVSRQDVSVNFL